MDEFVNPYSFVPLAGEPVRREPPNHVGPVPEPELRGRRVSGSIAVEWTLQTPLLLPATARHERWVRDDATVRIPGSSLKGAVRSVHEALFNGCLRVVDEDFVPAYREPAVARPGWRLAMVRDRSVENGKERITFQLCSADDLTYVDAVSLRRRWPRSSLPTTGDVTRLYGDILFGELERWELHDVEKIEVLSRAVEAAGRPAGEAQYAAWAERGAWAFLATDIGARHETKKNGTPGRCCWAASRLTTQVAELDTSADVWSDFLAAVRGSEDRRVLELADRPTPQENAEHPDPGWRGHRSLTQVTWRGRPVAMRARHTGFLHPRDVVWLRMDAGRITGIRLSQVWRATGKGAVSGRLEGAEPCLTRTEHGGRVCLSCATFGGADTGGSRRGHGEQVAYSGHVRFGSALSSGPVTPEEVTLAPLGAPRPGNGMFYLDTPASLPADRARDDIPTHWGSSVDPGGSTPVRGRKFYWHSDPSAQAAHWSTRNGTPVRPRFEATPKQAGTSMSRSAQLVPAGTVFTATVTVDGLPETETLALLWALDPGRLAGAYGRDRLSIAIHLGGGKPFGLGSATVTATPHLTTSPSRYLDAEPAALRFPDSAEQPQLEQVEKLAGPGMRTSIPVTLKLLDRAALSGDEHLVTYPPGASWSDFGTDEFRLSYRFFATANGEQLEGHARPWHRLPDPAGESQRLPVTLRGKAPTGRHRR